MPRFLVRLRTTAEAAVSKVAVVVAQPHTAVVAVVVADLIAEREYDGNPLGNSQNALQLGKLECIFVDDGRALSSGFGYR